MSSTTMTNTSSLSLFKEYGLNSYNPLEDLRSYSGCPHFMAGGGRYNQYNLWYDENEFSILKIGLSINDKKRLKQANKLFYLHSPFNASGLWTILMFMTGSLLTVGFPLVIIGFLLMSIFLGGSIELVLDFMLFLSYGIVGTYIACKLFIYKTKRADDTGGH